MRSIDKHPHTMYEVFVFIFNVNFSISTQPLGNNKKIEK